MIDEELQRINRLLTEEIRKLKTIETQSKNYDLSKEIAESKQVIAKLKKEYAIKKMQICLEENKERGR